MSIYFDVTTIAETPRLLLTIGQAAQELSLSRSKIYELLGAGEIRSVRIGRSRRIPRQYLIDYVTGLDERVAYKYAGETHRRFIEAVERAQPDRWQRRGLRWDWLL